MRIAIRQHSGSILYVCGMVVCVCRVYFVFVMPRLNITLTCIVSPITELRPTHAFTRIKWESLMVCVDCNRDVSLLLLLLLFRLFKWIRQRILRVASVRCVFHNYCADVVLSRQLILAFVMTTLTEHASKGLCSLILSFSTLVFFFTNARQSFKSISIKNKHKS